MILIKTNIIQQEQVLVIDSMSFKHTSNFNIDKKVRVRQLIYKKDIKSTSLINYKIKITMYKLLIQEKNFK